LLQPLQECPDTCLRFRIVRGEIREDADPLHIALLRPRHNRPCRRRATEQMNSRRFTA
jgi:hypothetical protein